MKEIESRLQEICILTRRLKDAVGNLRGIIKFNGEVSESLLIEVGEIEYELLGMTNKLTLDLLLEEKERNDCK